MKGYYPGIWMMNPDGSNKKLVRKLPSDAIGLAFSPDISRIYFAGALEFNNYSPASKPGFHNMDLLYIDTSGTEMELITNLGAYGISANSQVTSDGMYIQTNIVLNADLMGAVKIPTNTVTDRSELINYFMLNKEDVEIMIKKSKLMSENNNFFHPLYPRDNQNLYYYKPLYIYKKSKTEPIRLIYDGNTEKVEDVMGIRSIYPFADGKRLLMVRQNGPGIKDNGVYIIDAETANVIEEIELDMSAFGKVTEEL